MLSASSQESYISSVTTLASILLVTPDAISESLSFVYSCTVSIAITLICGSITEFTRSFDVYSLSSFRFSSSLFSLRLSFTISTVFSSIKSSQIIDIPPSTFLIFCYSSFSHIDSIIFVRIWLRTISESSSNYISLTLSCSSNYLSFSLSLSSSNYLYSSLYLYSSSNCLSTSLSCSCYTHSGIRSVIIFLMISLRNYPMKIICYTSMHS